MSCLDRSDYWQQHWIEEHVLELWALRSKVLALINIGATSAIQKPRWQFHLFRERISGDPFFFLAFGID